MKKFLFSLLIVTIYFLVASTVLAANEKSESAVIVGSGTNLNMILKHNGVKKNVQAQINGMSTYTDVLTKNIKGIKLSQKYAINNFIVYGTKETKTLTTSTRYQLITSYQKKYKKLPLSQIDWINLLKMNSSKKTICNNYECLISAASKCQPISVTISYTMPFLFDPNITQSGKTLFKIQKATGVNDCVLTFSSPTTVFSISAAGRKAASSKGSTDTQINAQLQTMNDSAKSTSGIQSICSSKAGIIAAYLTDAKNLKLKTKSNGQTTTYTTSSGHELVCKI